MRLDKCIKNNNLRTSAWLSCPSVEQFTCETRHVLLRVQRNLRYCISARVEHYETTSLEGMSARTLARSPAIFLWTHTCMRRHSGPTLKSEQTSMWSGLLKIDKSLTSVSGAQAAYVGRPLDIWQADRALFPTWSDIREYASQTSNCLKVRELLTARYRGQLSLPYDLCSASRPKVILPALSSKKKIYISALLTEAMRRMSQKELQWAILLLDCHVHVYISRQKY